VVVEGGGEKEQLSSRVRRGTGRVGGGGGVRGRGVRVE